MRPRANRRCPRLLSLFDELRDELAHPLVAPAEDAGIIALLIASAFHHLPQIADDRGGVNVCAARGDERLMHVQRNGESTADT